ncbi:hypothetical protein GCM10027521_35550 [Amycolatopsis cihanbeyliensis]
MVELVDGLVVAESAECATAPAVKVDAAEEQERQRRVYRVVRKQPSGGVERAECVAAVKGQVTGAVNGG